MFIVGKSFFSETLSKFNIKTITTLCVIHIPLTRQRLNEVSDLNKQKGSLERHPVFDSNGNLVEKTKAMVHSAKRLFEFLENNEQAQISIAEVFDSSDCLRNVTDVIALMDETYRLVQENAPEIVYLEALIESLKNERDINVLILASSKMLRALGHIMPALSNPSPKLCITNPEDSVRAFKSLAHGMIDIRNHREIEVDETARQLLEFSSKVMYDTGKFIFKMNKSLKNFKKSCQNHQMKDVAVYNTIVDIMDSLADLFNDLNLEEKSNAIKGHIEFVKRIVVSLTNTILYIIDVFSLSASF